MYHGRPALRDSVVAMGRRLEPIIGPCGEARRDSIFVSVWLMIVLYPSSIAGYAHPRMDHRPMSANLMKRIFLQAVSGRARGSEAGSRW